MPDLRQSLPSRSAVVRKIEEAQDDAMREIREAALNDARTIHAIQRIKQLAVSAFIEIDDLYRTFAALQQEPGRSAVHQQRANEQIASVLLQTERAMGEVVSTVIGQIKAEVANPKPKEVRRLLPIWWLGESRQVKLPPRTGGWLRIPSVMSTHSVDYLA
jgi:hypothetical protein